VISLHSLTVFFYLEGNGLGRMVDGREPRIWGIEGLSRFW
jgi:hypothetical protein